MTNLRWNPFTRLVSQKRRRSYTTLNLNPNPDPGVAPVTFQGKVVTSPFGPNFTGTVQFTIDGTLQGTATLPNETVVLTPPPGTHQCQASYSGDAFYLPSVSAVVTLLAGVSQVVWFSQDELTVYVVFKSVIYTFPRPGGTVPWSLTTLAQQHGITQWYFVGANGNDGNAGTDRTHPLATIQKFITSYFNPGNGLVILPGVLVGSCITNTSNNGPPGNGGTPTNHIVFTCDDVSEGGGLGTALILIDENHGVNGWPLDSDSTAVFNIFNSNYLFFNGIIAQGAIGQSWAPSPYKGTPCGFKCSNGTCTGCGWQNCVALLAQHVGFKDQSGGTVDLTFDGVIAVLNGVTPLDHGFYLPESSGWSINRSISAFNFGFGYVFYGDHWEWRNSLSAYNHQGGSGTGGVYLLPTGGNGPGTGVVNGVIDHVTVYEPVGRGVEYGGTTTTTNSILWGNVGGAGDADCDSITSGMSIDHCNVGVLSINNPPPQWPYTNNVSVNPDFNNPSTGDFRAQVNFPGTDGKNMGCYT